MVNNPLAYSDPTGHMWDTEGSGPYRRTKEEEKTIPKLTMHDYGPPTSQGLAEYGSRNPIILNNDEKPNHPVPCNPGTPYACGVGGYSPPPDQEEPPIPDPLLFAEEVGIPTMKAVEVIEYFTGYSKGGYRALRWSIPTGPFEVFVEGYKQYNYDKYYHDELTDNQRIGRVAATGFEVGMTDLVSSAAGAKLAKWGSVGRGFGAAAGFVTGSFGTSAGMNYGWAKLNPGIYSFFGLGDFP